MWPGCAMRHAAKAEHSSRALRANGSVTAVQSAALIQLSQPELGRVYGLDSNPEDAQELAEKAPSQALQSEKTQRRKRQLIFLNREFHVVPSLQHMFLQVIAC